MARIHDHLKFGTLAAALGVGATTIDFGTDPGFATLASGDVIVLTVGDFAAKDPAVLETVHVTAYTAGGTTATVARAQEGTTELAHSTGVEWRHVATSTDFVELWDGVMVVVVHGSDAAVARPGGAAAVYWIGSVEPTNAITSDMWHNTTA